MLQQRDGRTLYHSQSTQHEPVDPSHLSIVNYHHENQPYNGMRSYSTQHSSLASSTSAPVLNEMASNFQNIPMNNIDQQQTCQQSKATASGDALTGLNLFLEALDATEQHVINEQEITYSINEPTPEIVSIPIGQY